MWCDGYHLHPHGVRDFATSWPSWIWQAVKVLAWRLSNTLDTSFCIEALEEAIQKYGTPEIFNTDQGSQFTSDDFTEILKKNDIKISMDGKGRWIDNVFIERLWKSVKYQDVYIKAYESIGEVRIGLTNGLIGTTNGGHQGLDNRTPDEVYWSTLPGEGQCELGRLTT